MNRKDFQDLADVRIAEAELLLNGGRPDGAYYLAGYAVECGLKACIAKRTSQYDFPPVRKVVEDCYTHNIETLVRTAELVTDRKTATDANPVLETYWSIVKDWNESSRYDRKTQLEAQTLFDAIIDPANGVLPWIKVRW